jgi:DNA modification methylase
LYRSGISRQGLSSLKVRGVQAVPRVADASIDLIITDPPYGIDLSQQYKNRRHVVRGDPGFAAASG